MSGAGLAATLSFTAATAVLLVWFMAEQKVPLSSLFKQ
jgi:Na+-driven multidrug efflux pump